MYGWLMEGKNGLAGWSSNYLLLFLFFLAVVQMGCEQEVRQTEELPFDSLAKSKREPEDTTTQDTLVIDADYSLQEALRGSSAPENIQAQMALADVRYIGFDSLEHRGQLVVREDLVEEVQSIFAAIRDTGYPIEQAIPIVAFGWSDDSSMQANNSSAFNYRMTAGGTKRSMHSYGVAIDINPKYNPYVYGQHIEPEGAVYDTSLPYTLTAVSPVVEIFQSKGWEWGGSWEIQKDYQHFEKN